MGNLLSSPVVQSAGDLGVQCSRNEAELKNLKMKHRGATETISSLEKEVREQKRIVQMLLPGLKPCDTVRAKLAEVSQERVFFEARMNERHATYMTKHAGIGQVYSTKLKKLEEMNHELRKQRDALSRVGSVRGGPTDTRPPIRASQRR